MQHPTRDTLRKEQNLLKPKRSMQKNFQERRGNKIRENEIDMKIFYLTGIEIENFERIQYTSFFSGSLN